MKQYPFFTNIFVISALLFLSACAPAAQGPIPTTSAIAPGPIPDFIPTVTSPAPSPTPIPEVTIEQRFRETVGHWRVAYFDRTLDQLCAMYADGSDRVCLDFNQYPDMYLYGVSESSPDVTYGAYYGRASWSPDGSRLAFDLNLYGIYIWEVGAGLTPFREGSDDGLYLSPQWSPDGNHIEYWSNELNRTSEGGGVVLDPFVDSLDRTFHRQMPEDTFSMDWSPDGQRIAFASAGEIYVDTPTGGNSVNLTQSPANEMLPVWSPDGRSIAFFSDRTGKIALFVMDTTGGGVHQITDLPVDVTSAIKWSPDGRYVSFLSDQEGSFDLYAASVDGSGTHKVADLNIDFEHHVAGENLYGYNHFWLPDSQSILCFRTTYEILATGRKYTHDERWIELASGKTLFLDLPFDAASAEWFVPEAR